MLSTPFNTHHPDTKSLSSPNPFSSFHPQNTPLSHYLARRRRRLHAPLLSLHTTRGRHRRRRGAGRRLRLGLDAADRVLARLHDEEVDDDGDGDLGPGLAVDGDHAEDGVEAGDVHAQNDGDDGEGAAQEEPAVAEEDLVGACEGVVVVVDVGVF